MDGEAHRPGPGDRITQMEAVNLHMSHLDALCDAPDGSIIPAASVSRRVMSALLAAAPHPAGVAVVDGQEWRFHDHGVTRPALAAALAAAAAAVSSMAFRIQWDRPRREFSFATGRSAIDRCTVSTARPRSAVPLWTPAGFTPVDTLRETALDRAIPDPRSPDREMRGFVGAHPAGWPEELLADLDGWQREHLAARIRMGQAAGRVVVIAAVGPPETLHRVYTGPDPSAAAAAVKRHLDWAKATLIAMEASAMADMHPPPSPRRARGRGMSM